MTPGMELNDMGWVWGAYGLTAAVLVTYAISLTLRFRKERR